MRKTLMVVTLIVSIIGSVALTSCKHRETNAKQYESKQEEEVPKKRDYKENNGEDALVINRIINKKESNNGKKVAYLTFDDGPSTNITPKVLDVLKENNIKATFFVCGKNLNSDEAKEILGREADEGNSIGNHSFSHDYYKLYPNENVDIEAFNKEIQQTDNLIKESIGENFNTRLIRIPNGEMTRRHLNDKNIQKLINDLKSKDKYSIDWNALTGDAEGEQNKTPEELLRYLKETSKGKEKLIILMHDSAQRQNSLEALPEVIKYLKSQGYEFQTIK